jgi:SAM-dependent methyltransferase
VNWLGKVRPEQSRGTRPASAATSASVSTLAAHKQGTAAAKSASSNLRLSNGLKDFLWLLSDLERGCLLDLGPVSQATVSFFTERNFKVYTEDLLRSWKEFLRGEEQRLRSSPVGAAEEMEPAAMAERFLESSLRHPEETFDAVLAWDVLDYLDEALLPRAVQRLCGLLRPGGVALAIFHSRAPEGFHRYRVHDAQNIELLPAAQLFPCQRVLQNREILKLFEGFQSSKTFVGRDQLREALFTK